MRALDQIVNRVLLCFYAKMPAPEVSCEMRTGWQLYGIYIYIYICHVNMYVYIYIHRSENRSPQMVAICMYI